MSGELTAEQGTERGPVSFPPPLVYVAGLLLGWGAEIVAPTPNLPSRLAWTAVAVAIVASIALDIGATRLFLQRRTGIAPWTAATNLVTDGPYRVTRNPMYLGMAFLYLGVALGLGLLWGLAAFPVVIAVIDRAVIRREEAYLEAKFGAAYDDYRSRVRRWI